MRKSSLALFVVALLIIGLFAAVRISFEHSSPISTPGSKPSPAPASIPVPSIDPTFYLKDGDVTSTPAVSQASEMAPLVKVIPIVPSLNISAKAYLIGDIQTGKIYAESHSSTPLPVASMSKLITAIIATNSLSASTTVRISRADAAQPIDESVLLEGESFSVKELMYPLLMSSSNAAAEALASSSNRADFLGDMSSVAWEIGMPTAYFADPSGLSSKNRASPRDMFALAKYLYTSRPDILEITRTPDKFIATSSDYMFELVAASSTAESSTSASSTSSASATSSQQVIVTEGHAAHDVVSTHPFIIDKRFLGGKTGRTLAAGETMLTILNMDGHPVAFIVLGSSYGARAADTNALIGLYESKYAPKKSTSR